MCQDGRTRRQNDQLGRSYPQRDKKATTARLRQSGPSMPRGQSWKLVQRRHFDCFPSRMPSPYGCLRTSSADTQKQPPFWAFTYPCSHERYLRAGTAECSPSVPRTNQTLLDTRPHDVRTALGYYLASSFCSSTPDDTCVGWIEARLVVDHAILVKVLVHHDRTLLPRTPHAGLVRPSISPGNVSPRLFAYVMAIARMAIGLLAIARTATCRMCRDLPQFGWMCSRSLPF